MGAGYVGMALLNFFQGGPHEIYITTTKESRAEELKSYGKGVFVLDGNTDFRELIQGCDGMIVMVAPGRHLANYEETYLKTARRIKEALKERQKPFYLLYTGSTSVCELEKDWVTEETPLSPQSENAKILLETEQTFLSCAVNTCILRLGGIYGPNRELTQRARSLSGMVMSGTGDEATNHIHLEDILRGINFCLDHSLTGLYHLVNDDHPTRKELYTALCETMGIPPPIWKPDKIGKKGYKISNQKIKAAGYVFKHPLNGV